jgi:7,8-dihydropterin-6-yl-methyl-4-(beta-D-ribofuranosyl)aminobenzene 5'-phosphate synthase
MNKMRWRTWGWLLALAACLGGLCIAHQAQVALAPPAPSPSPQPVLVTAQIMVETAAPTTLLSTPAPTHAATPEPAYTLTSDGTRMTKPAQPITLTIVYDNLALDARLKTAWGFACLVETSQSTVLFDTGGDGLTLMNNLETLGMDPRQIDAVILSHFHEDHIGGLDALAATNDHLTAFIPQSFPDEFKTRVSQRAPVIQVREPMTIADHIRTTGELGTAIIEQSLIVETDKGLIVMTGCAHPGIVEIVRRAKAYGEVYLVTGGFHLGDKSAREVDAITTELKRLGVRQVAPCHCTGDEAIQLFRAAFGAGFIQVGAGAVIHAP